MSVLTKEIHFCFEIACPLETQRYCRVWEFVCYLCCRAEQSWHLWCQKGTAAFHCPPLPKVNIHRIILLWDLLSGISGTLCLHLPCHPKKWQWFVTNQVLHAPSTLLSKMSQELLPQEIERNLLFCWLETMHMWVVEAMCCWDKCVFQLAQRLDMPLNFYAP